MNRSMRCCECGGRLYHEPRCQVAREELVIEALEALQWAYAGAPLYVICPCQLGYPGLLGCTHSGEAKPLRRFSGRRAASPAR